MAKKILPETQIIPGMLSGIDYAELIKRESNTIVGKVEPKKVEKVKTKVYKSKRR